MATRRKRAKKVSKRTKKVVRKRVAKKVVSVPIASLNSEIGLLQSINKKVSRIDHTVNGTKNLLRKAKHAKRRREDLESAWAEREQHGYE